MNPLLTITLALMVFLVPIMLVPVFAESNFSFDKDVYTIGEIVTVTGHIDNWNPNPGYKPETVIWVDHYDVNDHTQKQYSHKSIFVGAATNHVDASIDSNGNFKTILKTGNFYQTDDSLRTFSSDPVFISASLWVNDQVSDTQTMYWLTPDLIAQMDAQAAAEIVAQEAAEAAAQAVAEAEAAAQAARAAFEIQTNGTHYIFNGYENDHLYGNALSVDGLSISTGTLRIDETNANKWHELPNSGKEGAFTWKWFYDSQRTDYLSSISWYYVEPEPSITEFQTGDTHYEKGNIVTMSGMVVNPTDSPVKITTYKDGRLVGLAFEQAYPNQDGSFVHTLELVGNDWKESGNVMVRAVYEKTQLETEFSYNVTPEPTYTNTVRLESDTYDKSPIEFWGNVSGGFSGDRVEIKVFNNIGQEIWDGHVGAQADGTYHAALYYTPYIKETGEYTIHFNYHGVVAGKIVTVIIPDPTPIPEPTPEPEGTTTPTELTATAISSSQIKLSWLPPSETFGQTISGYEIKQEVVSGVYDTVGNTDGVTTTFTVNNLSPDKTYTYAVSANIGFGSTGDSNIASATTQEEPVPEPEKVEICHNENTIEVSSNAVDAHLNHGDTLGECIVEIQEPTTDIPLNLEFDQLNYQSTEVAKITLTGNPLDIISMLIIDPSDKPKGESKSITLQTDGTATYNLDLDGYASGKYTAVISKGSTQNTEIFTVDLQTGSGDIDINTTKIEYLSGDSILILGDTSANALLTITLIDPNGNIVQTKETFSDKNGKISENSFSIPTDAITGTWVVNAKSGSNSDIAEINVVPLVSEGMTVFVEQGTNIPGLGDTIIIKVFGAQQNVQIEIISEEGEIIGSLDGIITSAGTIDQLWAIPSEIEPGIYTITVTDSFETDSINFTIGGANIPTPEPTPEKVEVCHNDSTIKVSAHAIDAHLSHSDTLGACVVEPEPQSDDNHEEAEEIVDEITETDELPERIPDWVKHIFVWYGQGLLDDEDLIEMIQYLIDEDIVQVV